MIAVDQLIERCRSGDQDAARQLVQDYAKQLLPVARRRISQRLASRIDAEDVIQTVFGIFFSRLQDNRLQFTDPDALARVLVGITIHRVLKEVAYHTAAKRDFRQEFLHRDRAAAALQQRRAVGSGPDKVVAFLDQLDHLFEQLAPADQRVLQLRMQGWSTADIAGQLHTYDRKIRRALARVRGAAAQVGLMNGGAGWDRPDAASPSRRNP